MLFTLRDKTMLNSKVKFADHRRMGLNFIYMVPKGPPTYSASLMGHVPVNKPKRLSSGSNS